MKKKKSAARTQKKITNKNTKAHSRKGVQVRTNRPKGMVGSVVDAAVEMGQAAESFLESWSHVKAARRTGDRVVKKAKKVSKGAYKQTKRLVGLS